MGAGCSAPCCCGVRPQTPQSTTRVHPNFLINYLSLPGTGSRSRPGGQQRAPISHQVLQHPCSVGTADTSCDAAAVPPHVLAPPETPCAVGQIHPCSLIHNSIPCRWLGHQERSQGWEGSWASQNPAWWRGKVRAVSSQPGLQKQTEQLIANQPWRGQHFSGLRQLQTDPMPPLLPHCFPSA